MAKPLPLEGRAEAAFKELTQALSNFESALATQNLRGKVIALIPAINSLRKLGVALEPTLARRSARDRILHYLQRFPRMVIEGSELAVVSGISEWPRRVRELRVEHGWWIYSGVTFRDIASADEAEARALRESLCIEMEKIRPDQYVLVRTERDEFSAVRWRSLNAIRRRPGGAKEKILEHLRANVGREVSGEELRYIAGDKKEWARRVRELRTEDGWPIATRSSGRPDLSVGVYVLDKDRQAYAHDRQISDSVRVEVLERDQFSCVDCGWARTRAQRDDPRTMLELHHLKRHVEGGANTIANLITLCNVCHDRRHARSSASKKNRHRT